MHFFKKNRLTILIILFFAFLFLTLLFYKKSFYLDNFDSEYWKDRYEHSRHFIPLSQRGIGDDGVYAYGGYKLVSGEDPTRIVYDKPALGVFLIGLSIKIFNNPFYSGLIFGLGSIIIFYFLAIRLLKDKLLAVLSASLFSLSPIVFSHFYVSLLDVPQMFFILLNVLLFYEAVFTKSKHIKFLLLLGGFTLGISAQIKIPIFLPIIFLLQIMYMIYLKKFKPTAYYLFGFIISGIISYSFYFFHNYSFLTFIKIQKYITSFYTDSTLPFHPHAIWQFLLTGHFPNVSSGVPFYIQEWSLILPIFTILGLTFCIYIFFTKNNLFWKGTAVYILSIFLIFTLISTYPRHFLIIYPFLILINFKFISSLFSRRVLIIISLLLLIYSVFNAFIYLNPKPSDDLSRFYYNYGKFYFQDVYKESLANSDNLNLKRDEFYKDIYDLFQDASVNSIEIKELENNIGRFDSEGEVTAEFKYNTYFLGPYTEIKRLKLKKINNEWKIIWDWDYVFNDFKPQYSLKTEKVIGKRGKIVSNIDGIFAEDINGYLIEFNPTMMDPSQENNMLNLLNSISLKGKLDIQNAYLENVPKNTYIPLVTTYRNLKVAEIQELKNYKGLRIREHPARHYGNLTGRSQIDNTIFKECCTKIYSSYNYHGTELDNNPEFNFDKQLSGNDGGKLMMFDKNNRIIKTLIDKKSKDGNDIEI